MVVYGGLVLLFVATINDLIFQLPDAYKSTIVFSFIGALLIIRDLLTKVSISEDVLKQGHSLFRAHRTTDIVAMLTVLSGIAAIIFWRYLSGQTDSNFLVAVTAAVLLSSIPELFATSRILPMRAVLEGNTQMIMIDAPSVIETMARTECVVFAGVGACSQEDPRVSGLAVNEHSPYNEKQVLQLAASAELQIESVLAKAVVIRARQEGLVLKKPKHSEYRAGRGISAEVFDTLVHVGNESYMDELLVRTGNIQHKALEQRHHGKTVLYVAVDHECIGAIFIENSIGEETVAALRKLGRSRRTVLLSGDDKETIKQLARKFSFSEYFSGANIIERDEIMARIGERFVTTIVIKQSPNYPAARHAHAVVQFGTVSSDQRKPTVSLSGGTPADVNKIFKLADMTESAIKISTAWAAIFNVVSVSLAFGLSVFILGVFWNPILAVVVGIVASLFPHVVALWLKKAVRKLIIIDTQ